MSDEKTARELSEEEAKQVVGGQGSTDGTTPGGDDPGEPTRQDDYNQWGPGKPH